AEPQEPEQAASGGLPGAAGRVVALHLPGDLVGPAQPRASSRERGLATAAILRELIVVAAAMDELPQIADRLAHGRERVEARAAVSPIADQVGVLELAQ